MSSKSWGRAQGHLLDHCRQVGGSGPFWRTNVLQIHCTNVLQMSSHHCRHRQNWTNVLQTLPPKAYVLQLLPTTTARISQMSYNHCRQIGQMSSNHYRQTSTNVLPTPPLKPNVLLRILPEGFWYFLPLEVPPILHLVSPVLHLQVYNRCKIGIN